ncbi:MAG: hypothetical protein V4539_21730 [Bacteroidota bacterium]
MRQLFLFLFILSSVALNAQYKTFRIGDKGDTLNAIDMKGMKQGKWTLHVNALRGEPAYDEEGVFVNDRKEGKWFRFNTMGDPLAVENYKWGRKHGISRYYTITGIEREESWRAINPDKLYDTIDVPDPVTPNKYEQVVVKNEGSSLRHGTWKYFDPRNSALISSERYFMNRLLEPGAADPTEGLVKVSTKVSIDTTKAKPIEKPKPKEVLEFEKKTSGKKKAVRDGRTGGG